MSRPWLLDKVKASITIAFDTFNPRTKMMVRLDMMFSKKFDNGMGLQMEVGGSITVPCSDLGDVYAYGKD